jgi:hypothetical protein
VIGIKTELAKVRVRVGLTNQIENMNTHTLTKMAHRPPLPPPNGAVLSLLSALNSPEQHGLHLQAVAALDQALSASPESYGNLCVQLALVMIGSDHPEQMMQQQQPDGTDQMIQSPALWIPLGQMAGLVLKNALLRPPMQQQQQQQGRAMSLLLSLPPGPVAEQLKELLLTYALQCQHAELRAVASSVIATSAVSPDGLQPALHIRAWPQLVPQLLVYLQQQQDDVNISHNNNNNNNNNNSDHTAAVHGALVTVRKILEDGPSELSPRDLDALVPALLQYLHVQKPEAHKVQALQSLAACLTDNVMPSALVLEFDAYLKGLSALAQDQSGKVRQWVCRSIVTLLELRTEFLQPHFLQVAQFMLLQQSSSTSSSLNEEQEQVALEACEFWLTFCSLDEVVVNSQMHDTVGSLLPQLVPVLLSNMVYGPEEQFELIARNDLDMMDQDDSNNMMRPVFHKSRAQKPGDRVANPHGGSDDDDDDDDAHPDDNGDDDGLGEEGENSWTLRRCAAASLDSLATIYGGEPLLPCLLPALETGLSSSDPWVQEASIVALGAIAEGCHDEMSVHMAQLYPYLMTPLAAPETAISTNLPQVKSIAAWTIGRYSSWIVEQVQTGNQGHLLAQVTQVFLARLHDRNRRVQAACCSAFGVLIEASGDLMAPYLQPIYEQLVAALTRYHGRSLLLVFDVFSIMADFCGPAIAEGDLPAIYIPPLLQVWDRLAQHDPADRTLLPLMECLASIAVTCGMNFQAYALHSFESAMCVIEMVTLQLATMGDGKIENEEYYDPVICATDLIDGLVEGLGSNFIGLLNSSLRYGQHFLAVLHSLCRHEIAGARMSALALLVRACLERLIRRMVVVPQFGNRSSQLSLVQGDLAKNTPALLEPAIAQLLQEAVANIDPIQPSVCSNAVWAVGEICVRCHGNPGLVAPLAPTLIQNLLSLLVGNGVHGDGGSSIPGLVENAASCLGRLAKVNPLLVAPDFPRLLVGWCSGMAKITDPVERRDAFEGFVLVVYVNPNAIREATANVAEAIVAIVFAILSWHLPSDLPKESTSLLTGEYSFRPFPTTEVELGKSLAQLMYDMKNAVGDEAWQSVLKELPVNVRRLFREAYNC